MKRRDIGVFLLGFAVGMFFLLSWASRTVLSPMFSSYFMAQITAVAVMGGALWLLLKKPQP
jgi:hypothetical protein